MSGLSPKRSARVSTPILAEPTLGGVSYATMGSPRLYPGHQVTLEGALVGHQGASLSVRLFLRHWDETTKKANGEVYGAPVTLAGDGAVRISIGVPDLAGWPVSDLGIEVGWWWTGSVSRASRTSRWTTRFRRQRRVL